MNKHLKAAFQRKQNGQSLVELGLTIVILLWLLAGAVNFGMAYMSYVIIRDAAQEGAVYGAINPTDLGGIQQRVRESIRYGSASNQPEWMIDPDDTVNFQIGITTTDGICPGNTLKVTTSYNFYLTIPFVDMMINNPIPLHASATSEILKKVNPSCPPYHP